MYNARSCSASANLGSKLCVLYSKTRSLCDPEQATASPDARVFVSETGTRGRAAARKRPRATSSDRVRSDRGSRIGRGREMGTVAQQTETRGSSLGVTTSAISIAAPSSWPSRVAGAGGTRSGAEPAPSCWTAAPLGHRGSPRPITAMEGNTAGHTLHRDRHRAGPSGGSAPGNVTCTDNWFPALTVRQPRGPGHVGGSRHPHPDRYQAGTGEGQHGTPRPSLAGTGTFYIGAGGWGVGLHLHPPEPLKFSISFHGEYNR